MSHPEPKPLRVIPATGTPGFAPGIYRLVPPPPEPRYEIVLPPGFELVEYPPQTAPRQFFASYEFHLAEVDQRGQPPEPTGDPSPQT